MCVRESLCAEKSLLRVALFFKGMREGGMRQRNGNERERNGEGRKMKREIALMCL